MRSLPWVYTMVYGIAKMLNFAHGDIIMVGGYAVLLATTNLGLPPIIGILAAVVFCTVLGVTIERVAYRPLRNAASPLAVLITAIGSQLPAAEYCASAVRSQYKIF